MMKSTRQMKFRSRMALAGTTATVAAAVALFAVPAPEKAGAQSASETYSQLELFGAVFEEVREKYVEQVSDKELMEAAISGMLTSLDPHSSFLNAKSFRDMREQTRGEFGGLGIEVSMENGYVKVVSPIDDTPAARAGLLPGDLITHLEGEPVLGLTLGQAVERMRGPVDSDLTVSIRRDGEESFDVTLTRAVIRIRSVRSRMIDDIGYIRITTFNEQTTSGLHAAIGKIKAEQGDRLTGYVIDLRNNPGGLLDEAISVSDTFLEQGEIVSTRGRDPDDASRVHARSGDLTEGKPIVVLINGGSASASEIVAGALQDHRRAILLGSKSFGKGSVQTILPLSGEVAMRLTTARYYTPSGRSIQQTGIEPDIAVPLARIERIDIGSSRREADLRGALNNQDNAAPATPGEAPGGVVESEEVVVETATEPEDYQLSRAIDLLRGIGLYRERIVN